jgi:hypothetical protein
MRLVPEDVLAAKIHAFDALRSRLVGRYDLTLLDDPQAGRFLKYYLLLTEAPELLVDQAISPEDLFWSRYYWFLRFARLRQTTTGYDAGLEQQAFQILEYPWPECEPDWSLLELVESAVGQGDIHHSP